MKCEICKEEITEFEVPDVHHKNGNHADNRKENKMLVHHKCHMIHHGIYPQNYNDLRQYVELSSS